MGGCCSCSCARDQIDPYFFGHLQPTYISDVDFTDLGEVDEELESSNRPVLVSALSPQERLLLQETVDDIYKAMELACAAYWDDFKNRKDSKDYIEMLNRRYPGLPIKDDDVVHLNDFLEKTGWTPVKCLDEHGQKCYCEFYDTQVCIATTDRSQTLAISFRGTEKGNCQDLVTDFMILASRFDPYEHLAEFVDDNRWPSCTLAQIKFNAPLVHRGMYIALLAVLKQIDEIVEPLLESGKYKHFVVTGHSLGGALAVLYFACLLVKKGCGTDVSMPIMRTHSLADMFIFRRSRSRNYDPPTDVEAGMCAGLPAKVSLITFGQPQVGNCAFHQWLQETMAPLRAAGQLQRIRVENSGDPIPLVASAFVSFMHEPDGVAIIDAGGKMHLHVTTEFAQLVRDKDSTKCERCCGTKKNMRHHAHSTYYINLGEVKDHLEQLHGLNVYSYAAMRKAE